MDSIRWRALVNPIGARRGLATLIAVVVLATMSAGPALGRKPGGSPRQPADDTHVAPRSPDQTAFAVVKLDIATGIRRWTAATLSRSAGSDLAAPDSSCVSDCGGGAGSGSDGSGIGGGTGGDGTAGDASGTGSPGGSGGSFGATGPAISVVLEARARRQSTGFWCGPASGQVVINYSRGYVFSSLSGDSATTNWKTQDAIAGWMKTTESSGTLGSNLATALNRPDAVLKPVADWSYLYATNADGADMHAKIVTDIWKFGMPLVIAVKPHAVDADYYLPSWPRELPGGKHWITIFGYDGLWDGTDGPQLHYTESAGNGAKGPGPYIVGSLTMWKVNQYNAKTIVW